MTERQVTRTECDARHGSSKKLIGVILALAAVFLAVAGYAAVIGDTARSSAGAVNERVIKIEQQVNHNSAATVSIVQQIDKLRADTQQGIRENGDLIRRDMGELKDDIRECRDLILRNNGKVAGVK